MFAGVLTRRIDVSPWPFAAVVVGGRSPLAVVLPVFVKPAVASTIAAANTKSSEPIQIPGAPRGRRSRAYPRNLIVSPFLSLGFSPNDRPCSTSLLRPALLRADNSFCGIDSVEPRSRCGRRYLRRR